MRTLTITLLFMFILTITVKAETRRFWTANIITAAATVYDIETTLYALKDGRVESNPLIRPFTSSRAKIYPIELGVDALVALWSHKTEAKHRFWPQIALTASHGAVGTLNLTWSR